MTWFKVDDKSAFHSKVVIAGNEAWGALCRAGAWSSGESTDGMIPDQIAFMIATEEVWKQLETCGGDRAGLVKRVKGGWQIHQFTLWNPPAELVKAAQLARQEKARSAAIARWSKTDETSAKHASSIAPSIDRVDACAMPRARDPVPSRPDPDSVPTEQVTAVAAPTPEAKRPDPDPVGTPLLTHPDPKPAKRTRAPKQQSLVVKVPAAVGWKLWRDLYQQSKRNYGRYVDSDEDGPLMPKIVGKATDHAIGELNRRSTPAAPVEPVVQAILSHWFKEYLRDDGGTSEFIAEQRHPLRYVLKGVTKYGTPWSKESGSSGLPDDVRSARESLLASTEVLGV